MASPTPTQAAGVTSTDASPTRQRYTFLAAQGRLYARNVDGKTVDLGALAAAPGGGFAWRLDGNQRVGQASTVEAALRDAAARMGFLYLDGQFTAVTDTAPPADATAVEVELDELQPGERMEDARV